MGTGKSCCIVFVGLLKTCMNVVPLKNPSEWLSNAFGVGKDRNTLSALQVSSFEKHAN